MSKQEWLRHMTLVTHPHNRLTCFECNERRKTRLSNKARADRDNAMTSLLGLVMVRTTNWE